MNAKQKSQFKAQINSIISKKKITIEDIKKVIKRERQDFVNNELLTINKLALQWALINKIISPNELKTNEFFTKNASLSDFISETGIATLGVGGAVYALNVAIAPVFLGLGGGFAAVGVVATVFIAAPIAVAGASIFAIVKYKENKEVERLEEYFKIEKTKILDFYFSKINRFKMTVATIPKVKTVEKIKTVATKKITTQNKTAKKTVPSSTTPPKRETKPNIKQIEKDIDYDKCVVRYDDKLKVCTIKYKDSLRGKKHGLHGETFESFAHKIPYMVGVKIFNGSGEIIFIGTKSNFTILKNECKIFKDTDNLEINILFRNIATKSSYE